MRRVSIALLILSGCARISHPSAERLFSSAETLLKQGDLKNAQREAEEGLRLEPSWRFRLLDAEVLLTSAQPKAALDLLNSASPPADPASLARLNMHEAQASFMLGDPPAAEKFLAAADRFAQSLPPGSIQVEIELRRGPMLVRQGRTAEADTSFRNALRGAIAQGDLRLQASAIGNLGVLFLYTHRPEEAIYWLERALEVSKKMGSAPSTAKALGNLGSCYYRLGDYDKALVYLQDAEARVRQLGDAHEQQIWLGNIGNVYYDRHEYPQALEKYQQALAIAQRLGDQYWTGWWQSNLALASIDIADYDAAERYNNQALNLKRDTQDQSDLYPRVNQARIAAGRRNFADAATLYRAVLARPSEDPTPTLQAESGIAQLLIETKQFDLADAQFREAIAIVEQQRAGLARDEFKLSYLASLIDCYQRYVEFLVSRGENVRALEVVESSRARVLDERLHSGVRPRSTVSAAALQGMAKSSGAILLSYWLAPERSYLWVVTPSAITLHSLPPEQQITPLVEGYSRFIEGLRDPLESEFPAGRKLSELLLGPVRPLLKEGTRIILVPDRALHALNFESLPDPDHASQYAIERLTIAVAPSLSLPAEARTAPSADRSLLLIGDPIPAVEEYPRLPYAAKEIALISANVPAANRVVMQGAEAYPVAYRDAGPERFSWIHFAAHAAANRENPLDSALILSAHDGGYTLSAREITGIPLRADLVTLSACRSAGAKAYSGEGLVGLSWAFLRAGAHNVVAGLWDVTDMSTAAFMADFYAHITAGIAPAEALRQAKLRLIHAPGAYRKPFYWAPFQLYLGAAPAQVFSKVDPHTVR